MINDTILTEDTIEKTKRYLKRYRKHKMLIERLKLKVARLDDRLTAIKSQQISDMPHGGSPTPIEDIISDKLETEERIAKLNSKGKHIKREILDKIDELEDYKHVEVMEAFCIDCKSFGEIADDIGYSERHVIKLYSEAIELIKIDNNN